MTTTITSVGVLGAGHMGSGIAQTAAVAGFETVCVDVTEEAVDKGRAAALTGRYGIHRAVELGKLDADEAERAEKLLSFTTDRSALAQVDVLIEAIPEDPSLKIRTFVELDGIVKPEAVFASNSSGLPIAPMAAATSRADRFLGWHWASPAQLRPLAEIVVTRETSEEAIEVVRDVATSMGKNPIVVRDTPLLWGYVTSRIFTAAMREARQIVAEKVATADDVDQLMIDCYGWPSGPLGITRKIRGGWG